MKDARPVKDSLREWSDDLYVMVLYPHRRTKRLQRRLDQLERIDEWLQQLSPWEQRLLPGAVRSLHWMPCGLGQLAPPCDRSESTSVLAVAWPLEYFLVQLRSLTISSALVRAGHPCRGGVFPGAMTAGGKRRDRRAPRRTRTMSRARGSHQRGP